MSFFVDARSIRGWAQATIARSKLPHVVRRLVAATVKQQDIRKIDFPAYESVQRPGFDGELGCVHGNAWVPEGDSVWELSVESKVGTKANNDYSGRTDNTPLHIRQASTYVCLTARQWRDKKAWAEEKRKRGEWKDVRVLDADDIEQWAETAPFGFVAWFGRQIGTRPTGVDDIAERWLAISQLGSHPLLPKVYLAGREQSVKMVEDWLKAPAASLSIASRSPTEVVDFFCAAVAEMGQDDRENIESRAVIITSTEAWPQLRDATTPAVLVIEPSVPLPAQELVRAIGNGHHVLVAAEPAFHSANRSTELSRASEFALRQAIEASGFTPVLAEQLARSAGGSLAILKHRLAPSQGEHPPWLSDVSPEVLSACLLLGGWGNSPADLEAFSQIARRSFADCEAELQLMSGKREPLLLQAAGNWRLISRDHAWSLFQNRVTPAALNAFERLAVDILADDDPRYQLPEERRLYANISGHVPKYTVTVKKHVSETIAFLGAFGATLQAAASIDVVSSVDRIVSSVLSPGCTWHRWASIGPRLPFLAEASPRTFLNAVRTDLEVQDSQLVILLHQEEHSLFGRCNHAGLLWALETLAWSNPLLPEVVRTLLVLASRDTPQAKWGNRPASTLCEILSYWLPQTTANINERIQVLDLLILTDQAAAWPILLKLLPRSVGAISDPTHRPYWRDWANQWEKGATTAESLAFIEATAKRVIEQAGTDSRRWLQIFEDLRRIPLGAHDLLLRSLSSFCDTEMADSNRRMLSEELAKQLNRHTHFASSHWALPAETVSNLASLLERLKPRDLVLRHVWLFAEHPDRFFERGGEYSDNEVALEAARVSALQEVLAVEGFTGVAALVNQAKSPRTVGFTLAKSTEDSFVQDVIPAYLEGSPQALEFAAGFVWARCYPDKWEWVDRHHDRCSSATAKANFLRCLRFCPAVWERAEKAGKEVLRAYWSTCNASNPRLEAGDVEAAVHKLLESERPVETLDLIGMALHQKHALAAETLLKPLESLWMLPAEKLKAQRNRIDSYDIQRIIEELQRREDIEKDRLIRIEWYFIHLLDGHSGHSPRTLEKSLATSPRFYNDVLSCCYRSDNSEVLEETDEDESTERDRYMSERAFHLLHDWSTVPGSNESGVIDEVQLRAWCNEARQIALEAGRLDVCDNHIGQLFARCKLEDPDGKWPCAAVRNVATEFFSKALASGMTNGMYNMRGAGFRGKGGDQERTLAQEFQMKADRIRFDSPRVAEVLDSMALGYTREATQWDERERWQEG